MVGITVGTMALFIVLSGFSGLKTFSLSLLNESDPDIKISPRKGKKILFSPEIKNALETNSEIASYARVVEERVFLKYKNKDQIAYVKGVDVNYNDVVPIDSSITVGSWIDPQFKNTAVIGYTLSYKLSLNVFNFGEPLQIFVPKPGKGYLNVNNAFNSENVQIIGAFEGSEEYQSKYVFSELSLAQKLLKLSPDELSSIALKVNNDDNVVEVSNELQSVLGDGFKVETRAEQNALYYKVVNTENFISYLIFTLIIVIALFNVIGAIIMMIIDKQQNLKTLFNLGASLQDIKKIFVFQGALLSIIGMIIGLTIGLVAVLIQQKFNFFMITSTVPYPVELKLSNLITVILTITVLGYIASKIASSRISQSFVNDKP